jgi:dihydropteroate synthase
MGIVNVTPDSFSDAGEHATADAAKAHCDRLCADGADILDIGGESTRPGAEPVGVDDQCARVLPVLRHALQLGVPVSIDTRHAAVMRAALDAGADIVNDVSALADAGAEQLLAAHRSAGVCLMHLRGEPSTMQQLANYGDVVADVAAFLSARAARLLALGVQRERIVLDPGIGFAKRHEHNLELHRRLDELAGLGYPLLVGWSRKASLGTITGRPVQQRLAASVAAALAAAQRGAAVLRVHDVAATVDALKVWRSLQMPAERVSSQSTRASS